MDLDKAYNKAKMKLIMDGSVFLSTITFSVKRSFTNKVPTAATDGLNIFINPDFFMSLGEPERVGLIAHEAWHIALMHFARVGSRDRKIYNMAGDYCINVLLTDAGFSLPAEALLDTKYRRWSTTRIYDDLIQRDKQPPPEFTIDILEPDPNAQTSSGDPMTAEDIANTVKGIVIKATTQAKMSGEKQRGSLPEEMERIIDQLTNPILDWGTILHNFFTEQAKDDYSWRKPNRRYFPDYYIPSLQSDSLSNITAAIDTSGSIDDEDLRKILSELESINSTYKPKTMTILDCDTKINHIHEINRDSYTDMLSLKFTGGGGTDFNPVIKYCNEHPTNVLLYFTDLYGHLNIPVQDYKLFWICYSDHPPWDIGETIYYHSQMRR